MSVQRPCGAPVVVKLNQATCSPAGSSGVASNDWSCEDCSTLGVTSETGRARRRRQGSAFSAHGRGRQSTNGGTRPSGSGRTCRRTTRGESGDSARRAIRSAGARVAMAAAAGGRRSCCRTAGVASSTADPIRPAGSPAADGPARAGAVSGSVELRPDAVELRSLQCGPRRRTVEAGNARQVIDPPARVLADVRGGG